MNFWRIYGRTQRNNGDSNKKSALMGIRFFLKREFDIISDGEFSKKSNQIFDVAIVELKRQGFGRADHHSPISKEDLKRSSPPSQETVKL